MKRKYRIIRNLAGYFIQVLSPERKHKWLLGLFEKTTPSSWCDVNQYGNYVNKADISFSPPKMYDTLAAANSALTTCEELDTQGNAFYADDEGQP